MSEEIARRIIKAGGFEQVFEPAKLEQSLVQAGADLYLAETITREILADKSLTTTDAIRKKVTELLIGQYRPLAGRYNLKRAIMQLGPSGFPFEKYAAELFKAEGYMVEMNQTLPGKCINHEVDILLTRDGKTEGVEVKFHNSSANKTDVKVSLYVKARFEDLRSGPLSGSEKEISGYWLVTNTKLTQDAITFAQCSGISALSWEQPSEQNLAQLVNKHQLHPVTSILSLPEYAIEKLVQSGIVLCKDLLPNRAGTILESVGIYAEQANAVYREAEAIASLQNIV